MKTVVLYLAYAVGCISIACATVQAGPLGTLDSSSRKAVREAEMQKYESQRSGADGATGSLTGLDTTSRRMVRESEMSTFDSTKKAVAPTVNTPNHGLLIQNTIDAQGHKKCVVSAGKVVTGEVHRGSSVENKTIVTGNIVNVCQ